MHDGLLSQEEIDALLGGVKETAALSESDKDLLGEIGNISMGSASTALSTILGRMVNITTPKVTVTNINEMKEHFEVPIVALEVLYTDGLEGANLLMIKVPDASVIADIMMGGDGQKNSNTLSEIEISAVSEAMNQMIGSSATSLSTMLNVPISISPPAAKLWDNANKSLSENIKPDQDIVKISFRLTIEKLLDSEIMLLLSIQTAKAIINKMTGIDDKEEIIEKEDFVIDDNTLFEQPKPQTHQAPVHEQPKNESAVNVQKAKFAPLTELSPQEKQNIDLILDVPLEISVVLGRARKTIKEILEIGAGSLVELDKLTEEPVEILVNGKKVALGEVVVIDENFGVRITSIISNVERVKSLQGK